MDEEVKTKILQLKLQRIQELNLKLKQSLLRDRIPTSQASLSIINYTLETPDYLIPTLWRLDPTANNYNRYQVFKNTRKVTKNSGCCTIV